MAVTVAVLAAGFAALLSGFAVAEKQVGSTRDDAQLSSLVRQVDGIVEANTAQGGLTYVVCAAASGATYQSQINSNAAITGAKGANTVTVLSVAQAVGGTSSHVLSTGTSALQSINSCSGTPDYGVQQITYRVTSTLGNSITRIVYKRWN